MSAKVDMHEDLIKEVPPQFRIAANELSRQFHTVVVDDYRDEALHVRVYRDEDTLNPTYYNIVKRNGVMYRQETSRQHALWPIYKSAPPAEVPKSALRRSTVSRLRAQRTRELGHEVAERNTHINVQSLFVDRAEVEDDIRDADLDFMNEPTIQNAMRLKALRAKLSNIELQIVATTIGVQAQRSVSA